MTAAITVMYARQLQPPIWLPAAMQEEYGLVDGTVAIGGLATYSNFRRFRVDVLTDIKVQPNKLQ